MSRALETAARPSEDAARSPSGLQEHVQDLGLQAAGGHGSYCFGHPYDVEVAQFQPSAEQLASPPERLYKPLHETRCTWVDTAEALDALRLTLNGCDAFAVDLEHHSQHSYRGFTCLVQVSTRNEDFLVDAMELREQLHVLNESFTNPSIAHL